MSFLTISYVAICTHLYCTHNYSRAICGTIAFENIHAFASKHTHLIGIHSYISVLFMHHYQKVHARIHT